MTTDNGFSFVLSLIFAAVMGLVWGGLIYTIHETAGLFTGGILFGVCFLVLLRKSIEPTEPVLHNRRFDDC